MGLFNRKEQAIPVKSKSERTVCQMNEEKVKGILAEAIAIANGLGMDIRKVPLEEYAGRTPIGILNRYGVKKK